MTKVRRDFTRGAILSPMLTFVIPIMLTNILQTMYSIVG